MNSDDINDKRVTKDFKGITFSKYKKSEAQKELLNSLIHEKIEPACYWSAEFICAGHYTDLWNIILLMVGRYIHLGNPKLARYIQLRYSHFRDIAVNGYKKNELQMRNNRKIRILFAEVIAILSLSHKKHPFNTIKIDKKDFEMANMTQRLKADNTYYANHIFTKGDPKELFIAINEFAFHLSPRSNNATGACYWLEWLLAFEALCKKQSNRKYCATRRVNIPVENKYQTDIIWIIWELLRLKAAEKGRVVQKIVAALLQIFCISYTPGMKRRRRFLIYFAISLLLEKPDIDIPIYHDSEKINSVKEKIDVIYRQIKKNEIKPKTDYLFNNSIARTNNLERTITKLNKMDNLVNFIPRNY